MTTPPILQLILCIHPDGWAETRLELPGDKRAQRERLRRMYRYTASFEPVVTLRGGGGGGDVEILLYETRLTRQPQDSILILDAQQWMNQQSNDSYIMLRDYALVLRWLDSS